MSPAARETVTAAVFAVTYLGLALGRLPWLRMDRAGIALVGAAALMVSGILPLPEAVAAVNYETLILLFGMMVLVAYLRLAHFFERLARWTVLRLHGPYTFLAGTIVLSGFLSAFLVNDVVCLALTPLVVHLARRLRVPALPHLLGLATAANIGSTATITGNPQNMIIGVQSGIPYLTFALRLGPVALVGLLLDFVVIAVVCRSLLRPAPDAPAHAKTHHRRRKRHGRPHRGLLIKALAVTALVVVLFFAGFSVPLVALGGAALMLLGRVRPAKVYRQIDWGLLVMFAALFVVVRAFNEVVIQPWGLADWPALQKSPVALLSLASAALSNLVSNVPAVLLFEPALRALPETSRETAWLALAMSSTLAGNLTVLGSVANLIVVEGARREGEAISFWDYLRVGLPVTVLTLLAGVAWLAWTG